MSTHVAMSSSCLFLGSMPEVFRTASELGYDSVEVLVTHQRTTQLTHELLDAVQTYQIPISAIHAPTLFFLQHVWGTTWDQIDRSINCGLSTVIAFFHSLEERLGAELDDLDLEGFRGVARAALEEFSSRKVTEGDWEDFARILDYVPLAAGAEALRAVGSMDGIDISVARQQVPASESGLSAAGSAPQLSSERDAQRLVLALLATGSFVGGLALLRRSSAQQRD